MIDRDASEAQKAQVIQAQVRRILRKDVFIPQQIEDETLQSIVMVLSSLVTSNFKKITIAKPLQLRLDENPLNNSFIEFDVDVTKRDLGNPDEQQKTIYLDEVIPLLLNIAGWLIRYNNVAAKTKIEQDTDLPIVKSLNDVVNLYFSSKALVKGDLNEDYQSFYTDRLFSKLTNIKGAARVLLIATDIINPTLIPEVFQFNSLIPILDLLKNEQRAAELVVDRDAWVGTFLPLLKAAQTPVTNNQGNQAIAPPNKLTLLSETPKYGNQFSPVEVVQLFHLWVKKGLRTVVEDPEEDHGYAKGSNKGKPIARILTSEEIEKITSNSSRILPREIDEYLTVLLDDSSLKDEDKASLEELLKFLATSQDPIMPKLLGEKEVEIAAAAGEAAPEAADAGGNDDQTTPQPPQQLTYDQIKGQIVNALALALLRDIPEFSQLESIIRVFAATEYPLSHSVYTKILSEITTELLSERFPNLATQLTEENIATLGPRDETNGTYIIPSGALPALQQQIISAVLTELRNTPVPELQAILGDLATRIKSAIEEDEQNNINQQTNEQLGTEENKQQIKTLLDEYRAAQASGQVSAEQETQYVSRINDMRAGAVNVFAPYLVRELLALNPEVTELSIQEILNGNPEFLTELAGFLESRLSAQDLETLFLGSTAEKFALLSSLRVKLLSEIKELARKLDDSFDRFVEKVKEKKARDERLQGVKADFARSQAEFATSENELTDLIANQNQGITPLALRMRVESIVGLIAQMDDPAAYIASLTPKQLAELLGVQLGDDVSFNQFKQKLVRHVDLFLITHHGPENIAPEDLADANIPHGPKITLFNNSKPGNTPTPEQLKNISQMVEAAGGPDSWNEMLLSEYGDNVEPGSLKQGEATEEDIAKKALWQQQRDLLIQELWNSMAQEERELILAQQTADQQAAYQAALLAASAGGAEGGVIPPGLTMAGAMGAINAQAAAATPQQPTGLGALVNRFRGQQKPPENPAGKMATSAAKTAAEMGLNVLGPGLGTALRRGSDAIKAVTGLDEKGQLMAGVGIIATLGILLNQLWSYLVNAIMSAGLWAGIGALGGFVGGFLVGGPVGAIAGATLGGAAGTALHGMFGQEGVRSGIGNAFSQASGLGQSGTTANAAKLGADTAAKAGLFSNMGSPAIVAAGTATFTGAVIATTVSMVTTLKPLPTISGDGQISPYVEITKTAQPNVEFENGQLPQTITYSVSIKAKEGYNITITSVTDTMSVRVNTETRPGASIPTLPTRSLTDFGKTGPLTINAGETLELGSYTQEFNSDFADTNVVNLFVASFTVAQGEGYTDNMPLATEPQTANASQSICFGECPQQQGACWPVAGRVTLLPYDPRYPSHATTDSIDIGAPIGTPVHSPFDGTIRIFSNDTRIQTSELSWGLSLAIRPSSGDFTNKDFIFAHLASYTDIVNPNGTATVKLGQVIGYVGLTGNTTGPHLHYELRPPSGSPSELLTLVPDGVQLFDNTLPVCGE